MNRFIRPSIDLQDSPLGSGYIRGGFREAAVITGVAWHNDRAILTVASAAGAGEVELPLTAEHVQELLGEMIPMALPRPELSREIEARFHFKGCAAWPLHGNRSGVPEVGEFALVDASLYSSDTVAADGVRLTVGRVTDNTTHGAVEVTHEVRLKRMEALDLMKRLLRPETPTHLVTIVRGWRGGHLNGELLPLPGHLTVDEDRLFETAERLGYDGDDDMFLLFTPLGEDSDVGSANIVATFQVEAR